MHDDVLARAGTANSTAQQAAIQKRRNVSPMRAHIPRIATCALALLLVAAANEPTATVTVDGIPLSYRDVIQLTALTLGAGDVVQNGLVKPPADMPRTSPYVYYAGTDAGGKSIVWVSAAVKPGTKLSTSETVEMTREYEEAGLLSMLASGKGNAAIQRVYAQIKNDPGALTSLGAALTNAMSTMSEKTVQYANDERRWIFRNVAAGTPRAHAQEMLREHGLVASEGGDTMVVSLPGAFAPGCYFSTNVTLTFRDQMRLYKIDLSQPIPDCL
jgi:hypothetical protein